MSKATFRNVPPGCDIRAHAAKAAAERVRAWYEKDGSEIETDDIVMVTRWALHALRPDRSGAVPPALTDADRSDAECFRYLQNCGHITAQAFFWNHSGRRERKKAILAALAAGSLQASTASPGGRNHEG